MKYSTLYMPLLLWLFNFRESVIETHFSTCNFLLTYRCVRRPTPSPCRSCFHSFGWPRADTRVWRTPCRRGRDCQASPLLCRCSIDLGCSASGRTMCPPFLKSHAPLTQRDHFLQQPPSMSKDFCFYKNSVYYINYHKTSIGMSTTVI